MLENYEMSLQERAQLLKAKINEAWDDPRPSRPADEVFGRIKLPTPKTTRPKNARPKNARAKKERCRSSSAGRRRKPISTSLRFTSPSAKWEPKRDRLHPPAFGVVRAPAGFSTMPAGRGMICGPVSVSSPSRPGVVIAYTVLPSDDIEIGRIL